MATDREMIEDITRLGIRAAVLLRGVMLKKVDHETLAWGLRELHPGELLARYFPRLVDSPDDVDLLNVLHLVYSLEGQLDFQVEEYGLDSVKDDMQELNASLQALAARHPVEAAEPPPAPGLIQLERGASRGGGR